MRDEGLISKEQYARELAHLRRRIADLEATERGRKWVEGALRIQRDLAFRLSSSRNMEEAANHVLDAAFQTESIDCGGMYLVDPLVRSP